MELEATRNWGSPIHAMVMLQLPLQICCDTIHPQNKSKPWRSYIVFVGTAFFRAATSLTLSSCSMDGTLTLFGKF